MPCPVHQRWQSCPVRSRSGACQSGASDTMTPPRMCVVTVVARGEATPSARHCSRTIHRHSLPRQGASGWIRAGGCACVFLGRRVIIRGRGRASYRSRRSKAKASLEGVVTTTVKAGGDSRMGGGREVGSGGGGGQTRAIRHELRLAPPRPTHRPRPPRLFCGQTDRPGRTRPCVRPSRTVVHAIRGKGHPGALTAPTASQVRPRCPPQQDKRSWK